MTTNQINAVQLPDRLSETRGPAVLESYCAVVGGGTMGLGIAYALALGGAEVRVVEPAPERRKLAVATLEDVAASAVRRGKLTEFEAKALLERIVWVSTLAQLPRQGAALVVEAVPERFELKRGVLREAEEYCTPAILASNTSSLSIDALAADLRHPDRFVGLHFFNPVWMMALVEVVRGTATAPSVLDAALALIRQIGKDSIVVRDSPGFATSRLGVAVGLEGIRMLEEGVASAADIDKALELGYRHPMGPLELTDLVGLDVRLDIARHLERELGPRFAPPQLLVDKVARGELGKKTGQGFYDWAK